MKEGNETRQLMTTLRPEINAVLAPIAKKHGLKSLEIGHGTYSASGRFTFKLEGLQEGGLDKDAERYKNSIGVLGLPPLGTEFRNGAYSYKTAGINTTGSKVICQRLGTENRYLYTVEVVKALTATQAKAA
jgi:hypothetical protein